MFKSKKVEYDGSVEELETIVNSVYNAISPIKKDLRKESVKSVVVETLNAEKLIREQKRLRKEQDERLINSALQDELLKYCQKKYGNFVTKNAVNQVINWAIERDCLPSHYMDECVKYLIKDIGGKYILNDKLILISDYNIGQTPKMLNLDSHLNYAIFQDAADEPYAILWSSYPYTIHLPKDYQM